MGTPCGDTIVSATRVWQTTSYYRPETRGFAGAGAPDVASPVVSWTVGGLPVPTGNGSLDVNTAEGVFTLHCELGAANAELVLVARGGERYMTEVVATASEPGGGDAVTVRETFEPVGWTQGFSAADLRKLDDCMARRFQRIRIRLRDWLVPRSGDPALHAAQDRINEARLRVMVGRIAGRHPAEAQELRHMIALRYE